MNYRFLQVLKYVLKLFTSASSDYVCCVSLPMRDISQQLPTIYEHFENYVNYLLH